MSHKKSLETCFSDVHTMKLLSAALSCRQKVHRVYRALVVFGSCLPSSTKKVIYVLIDQSKGSTDLAPMSGLRCLLNLQRIRIINHYLSLVKVTFGEEHGSFLLLFLVENRLDNRLYGPQRSSCALMETIKLCGSIWPSITEVTGIDGY